MTEGPTQTHIPPGADKGGAAANLDPAAGAAGVASTSDHSPYHSSSPLMSVPHAFHQNLPHPFHHYSAAVRKEAAAAGGENSCGFGGVTEEEAATATTIPYVTRIAHAKARRIVELATSLHLTPEMLRTTRGYDEKDGEKERGSGVGGEEGEEEEGPTTMTTPADPSSAGSEPEDLDVEDGEDDDDDGFEGGGGGGIDSGNEDGGVAPPAIGSAADARAGYAPASRRRSETLQGLTKKLSRLQTQLSGLEELKYGGITQQELCEMVLHLLGLLTCTVEYRQRESINNGSGSGDTDKAATSVNEMNMKESETTQDEDRTANVDDDAVLHFDNVGYLWQGSDKPLDHADDSDSTCLERPFALHSPAREVILLILLNIVSNKGPLRSVSNSSIYPTADPSTTTEKAPSPPRFLLILNWRALMRCLLRTAPYLDEHRSGLVTSDSHYRQSNVLRRTVQLVRDARHFFDQGVRPPRSLSSPSGKFAEASVEVETDATAKQVWDVVKDDVLYHSHTHACYRGTVLLYLFHPTQCSSQYYSRMMPTWVEAWTHIDRCPEYDFLYLALFCRARKYLDSSYDWGPVRRRLLTLAQYWLALPIGGAGLDKSFPQYGNPRVRSCPSRLKVFTGSSTTYEEGIDFIAKVVKLLVASVGMDSSGGATTSSNNTGSPPLSEGTRELLRFLRFATPYFNPINIGSWTFTLGALLHYFAYELCCRVGAAAGMRSLRQSHPDVAYAMEASQPGAALEIPPREVVTLMDVLLPLCQQAIYSKNPHVGRAGEAALLYLVQIDPARATPSFIDFATRALDVTSVTMAHQAPSALSALTRLIQPALRADPGILLQRLPAILNLSLKGIDSNDQNKTIRTLILYRSLTSWLPVGGRPETWKCVELHQSGCAGTTDGTRRIGNELFDTIKSMRECPEYRDAVAHLPSSSLLKTGESEGAANSLAGHDMQRLYLDEAVSALSDWAIEFLERVFGLLRASGEREKTAKSASRVANRHSNADVHQARNFSRVFQECIMQVFASMDDDVHAIAVRALVRFLEEESHPSAAKDASLLCQGAAAARTATSSPGLDALIPVLTNDLHRHSTKTSIYRVRCLAGAVRYAGRSVVAHRVAISKVLDYALASDDRHLFKTGCKLLRHLLSTLCESYPLASDSSPRVYRDSQGNVLLGRSGQLRGDRVQWHVPDGECIRFASDVLVTHVTSRLSALCSSDEGMDGGSRLLNSTDVVQLRRCLRVVRYSIRGGASALLDQGLHKTSDDFVAYEIASFRLIETAGQEVKESLLQLRGRMCNFLLVLASIVSSDTLHPDGHEAIPENEPSRKAIPLISSDPKVCKETCDLALLLLTRRGAAFRSQEARTIWVAQKQVAADFTLSAQVDYMAETLQNAARYGDNATLLYKDGEDAGKSIPRRLLVTRVQLFHASLQRTASFEVPRRMRRVEKEMRGSRNILFSVQPSLPESVLYLEGALKGGNHQPLDAYEGIIDGLFALCCHSNTRVRASAITVVNYALTRFGWIVASRVPRLLSGLSLEDESMNGKFGLPSCAALVDRMNQQGRRKRLAEAIKGVCSILSMTRAVRQMLGSSKMRHRFVETLCGTDHLISLLPAEEMQKTIHYLQSLFSPFRSSFYSKPRSSSQEREFHEKSIRFVLAIVSEKKAETNSEDLDSNESKRGAHWRKLLIASWFLLAFVDEDDVQGSSVESQIWATCFYLLEANPAQPLQRVALGLFGKLLCFVNHKTVLSELKAKMLTEVFCRVLSRALVYDHKQDTSFGGGHEAQCSSGVETILRDAGRLVAPRTLFPFQRTGQSLGDFKVAHSQLIKLLLLRLDDATAMMASQSLLVQAKELTAAPPSEDQRNQQITAAEIFAGVCGSLIRSPRVSTQVWSGLLLPSLEDGITKTPFSLCGSYFDAIRYALQFVSPEAFYPLTLWLTEKIKGTLWQPTGTTTDLPPASDDSNPLGQNGSSPQATEAGFTTQSKWLYLFSAVLIEMDETESDDVYTKPARFVQNFTTAASSLEDPMDLSPPARNPGESTRQGSLDASWRLVTESLLPVLAEAIGHPFDSCRDHISRCLFRICYSHRKFARVAAASPSLSSRTPSRSASAVELSALLLSDNPGALDPHDPGWTIVARLSSLLDLDPTAASNTSQVSHKNRMNSLITARRFISNCVHMGEAKFEFSDYVIPLLPLAFESLDVSSDDLSDISAGASAGSDSAPGFPTNTPPSAGADDSNNDAGRRALEAEVIKGFRGMISEVSVTGVISYGGRAAERDLSRVLDAVEGACLHGKWQVRHAGANYLRCFQGAHKFLLARENTDRTTSLVADLLADDRREVSSAAMAALTGILAAAPLDDVAEMVRHFAKVAASTKMRRNRGRKDAEKSRDASSTAAGPLPSQAAESEKERKRARDQQVSVFFLCASVLSCPYDTPPHVPAALHAISPHSFERCAPLSVRETVKRCCAEYKRTHMSDNWDEHRRAFTTEQLEAFEDVVSTPHYYA